MNPAPMKSWLDRLLETAILLVVIALLLNWAWNLIRPLIPVLVIAAGLAISVSFMVQRNRRW
jgi:MFS superfamily sulfate permease-like transporter